MIIWTQLEAVDPETQSSRLDDLFTRMVTLLNELPIVLRSPLHLQRGAGWLGPAHELVSRHIGQTLSRWPGLFPDVPDAARRGAQLLEREARASAWLALRDQLHAFSVLCQEAAVHEQSLAAQESTQVADHALEVLRHRAHYPDLSHGARLGVLLMGLVWRCESRVNGGRPRRKARARGENEALTPRQEHYARLRKEEHKAARIALFKAWMKRRT